MSLPITRRVYNLGLDEFIAWYGLEPRPGFTKATVNAWQMAIEARGLGPISINVRITAVRKRAVEAAYDGLLAPGLAAGVAHQIREYQRHGFQVAGAIGINGSPTCGVDTDWHEDEEATGPGVFIQTLESCIPSLGTSIPVRGVKAADPEAPVARALGFMRAWGGDAQLHALRCEAVSASLV